MGLEGMIRRLFGRPPDPGAFEGVFQDFDDAVRSVPEGQAIGYDSPATASFYRELLDKPRHDDYPAIFWLTKALHGTRHLLEVGGHVGVAYYSFERLIGLPEDFTWTILDTPAVAEAGRQLARERARTNLRFISGFEELSHPADILFAAGSLQYVPGPLLPERLKSLPSPPAHILINKTPVADGPGFVTLQHIGVTWCPYRVHSRSDLIDPLEALGYELVDSWQKDRQLAVPGRPELTLDHYRGFYLRRRG